MFLSPESVFVAVGRAANSTGQTVSWFFNGPDHICLTTEVLAILLENIAIIQGSTINEQYNIIAIN